MPQQRLPSSASAAGRCNGSGPHWPSIEILAADIGPSGTLLLSIYMERITSGPSACLASCSAPPYQQAKGSKGPVVPGAQG